MRPVVASRASWESPASPPGLFGSVPPSVNVAPPSVERAQPLKWFVPPALEPESSKPTTTVLPNATMPGSRWVKLEVAVAPALSLTSRSGPAASRRRVSRASAGVNQLGRGGRERDMISSPCRPAKTGAARAQPKRGYIRIAETQPELAPRLPAGPRSRAGAGARAGRENGVEVAGLQTRGPGDLGGL